MRNPSYQRHKKVIPNAKDLFEGIRNGDRDALAQGITLVESQAEKHQEKAAELLRQCLPYYGHAYRIGITGSPGVGKSSFIESWGQYLVSKGNSLAVLTIDPSSSLTKGSLLGDKTRMTTLSHHPNVFIRPSPSGTTLGGITHSTKECLLLCEAAGYDVILVETVGVGQSETLVRQIIDFFLLLLLPGSGDELQGIKRGIVELADAIAITKADGPRVELAKSSKKDFRNALHLFRSRSDDWRPKVLTCSSLEKQGLSQIWELILSYYTHMQKEGKLEQIHRAQQEFWFSHRLNDFLARWIQGQPEIKALINEQKEAIAKGEATSFTALQPIRNYISTHFSLFQQK